MNKKRMILLLAVLALGISAKPLIFGTRPLKGLTEEKITAVQVELMPPDSTIQLTEAEIARLIPLLREVVIYREDNSYRDYSGQAVVFTITRTGGSETRVMAYSPFLVLDGTGYRTKHAPCEALSRFANALR